MKFLHKESIQTVSPGVTVEEIIFNSDTGKLSPFKSSIFIISPNSTSTPDSHQVKECWVVVNGKGLLTCDGLQSEISYRDVIYFDSFEEHIVTNPYNEDLKIISIWWDA